MVGIVLVTHGEMAEGLLDAARMIVGEKEAMLPVQLREEDDVEGLMARVEKAIKGVDSGQGTLVLVDLPGASPFNASARIAMQADSINVVTGVNLPMLVEMLVQREGSSLDELTKLSKSAGTGGIKDLTEILNR